jgi:hypothetical protein
MATEVTEFAVGVAGEDFAAITTEEFNGGFGSIRSGLGESEHDRFGFGCGLRKVQVRRSVVCWELSELCIR